MRSRERGAASIEATISLTLFVFVFMAIYTLINYALVQTRVAYAIQTTAKEMSQYCYFYHVLGLDSLEADMADKKTQAVNTFEGFSTLISDSAAEINEISNSPTDYFGSLQEGSQTDDLNQIYADIQNVTALVGDVIDDPMEFMKSMGSLAGHSALNYATNIIAAPIAKGMTRRHFGDTKAEADAYLESLGVIDGYDGLNFNLSTMLDGDSDEIKIVVYYNMDLAANFPFDMKVCICQKASTRAWLGGDLK